MDSHPRLGVFAAFVTLGLMLSLFRYTSPAWLSHRVLAPLAFVWTAARLLEAAQCRPLLSAQISSALGLIISATVLWLMLYRFNVVEKSSTNLVAEGFLSYLVIAICFSQVYEIFDRTVAHAFSHPIAPPRGSTLLYFSLVTLTSIGSSDLYPIDPYLKMLAAFESVTGIFYLAVVVSRLASADRQRRPKSSV